MEKATFVIVGGGIAGVSCAEILAQTSPSESIVLISASPTVKAITNFTQVSQTMASFDVSEEPSSTLEAKFDRFQVIQDLVTTIDPKSKSVSTKSGKTIQYQKLCLCCGAKPKLLSKDNAHVIGIRDTESVRTFQDKLKGAKRVMVVGNGGIATELIHEMRSVEVVWAIKDDSISATFVDPGAGQFFLKELFKADQAKDNVKTSTVTKRLKYCESEAMTSCSSKGAALGPDWYTGLDIFNSDQNDRKITIEYSTNVKKIYSAQEFQQTSSGDQNWPVYVELTNSKTYGCDFVVSATGVEPNGKEFGDIFDLSQEGGIIVGDNMETSIKDIFAAGDICHVNFSKPSRHWFQMRLWTQARLLGMFAGQCMVASLKKEDIGVDFSFELFSHITKFFGFKVVLLGIFNAQGLDTPDYEALLRVTPGVEFIKVIMQQGRMQGAILIGETDLEETFENLILNQIDLSSFGEGLLDPNVDIEDFFD